MKKRASFPFKSNGLLINLDFNCYSTLIIIYYEVRTDYSEPTSSIIFPVKSQFTSSKSINSSELIISYIFSET